MSSLHQHAKDLFLAALAKPTLEREAFLRDACGTDLQLRSEVESLLAFHSGGHSDDTSASEAPVTPYSEREAFSPGDVFAGRYRMITLIGRGGMGDVWRADDLILETPVALKLIRGASAGQARERLLNEVRMARQITHPAVCRVFDVGEHDGQIFFSMELVHGEDLAGLLKQVGRLPSEKVIDIGRQLCEGLAAAHEQGVLHRDLKPANILIDDEGRVRITDFGIAVSRDSAEPHTPMGTPGYMAPEQLTPGAPLTERTDLFALGLILYELSVGQHPFKRTLRGSEPPRPSALVPHIDPRLEKTILRSLAHNPADRPASAAEIARTLPDGSAPAPAKIAPWILGLGVAVVVALLAAVSWVFLPSSSRPLSEQDTIVLADFANTTGEPVFDGALKVALAVALEQSPFLKVFPDERIRETLRLMGRSGDEALSRSVAREVAQREQLKALLAGSIAKLGRNYVIALEAINTQTGDVMAREQIEASTQEEVLTALGGGAKRLREKLGESLASIQKFDVPLARATTPSLEALHAYSLALDQGTVNPRLEALPHLRRALELDPNFALALALTATVYVNTGQTSLAPQYARRAFELSNRVSERERFFIAFRYYRDATQDWAKALELTRSWTDTYPREAFAFNSFGSALIRFGEFEQAVGALRQAIVLDPRLAAPYANLATSLIALQRFDEARAVIKDAVDRRLDADAIRRLSYVVAFVQDDAAGMASSFDATVARRDGTAYGWQAHAMAFEGRIGAAHDSFRRGIAMALQGGFKEVAAQMGIEDAEAHALVGQCDATTREAEEALALSRDNFSLERVSRALALCGSNQAAPLLKDLAERLPEATLTTRVSIPIAQAAAALQREPARTVDLLDAVRPYDRAIRAELWPPYLRGLAYLNLRDAPAAQREFQMVTDHRGIDPDSEIYGLAHLGLARAAALGGDGGRAQMEYGAFLTLWKNADADLQPVKDARAESAKLK